MTNKKEPTPQEYGRMGGQRTLELYGSSHFSKAGRLGGIKVSQDREYMSTLGRKGGKNRGKKNAEG